MKFFTGFAVSFLSAALVWCCLVYGQTGNPSLMSQWIHDVYQKKKSSALAVKERKILIVAGSNALFGIDSPLLSERLGHEVINYGVNAGILLPATLHKATEVIRQNDMVLMPLEYPMYSYNGRPNIQMMDYIYSRDPVFFFHLTLKEQFFMVWELPVTRLVDGYFFKGGQPLTAGLYGAFNINAYGDQINTGPKFQTPGIANELNGHTPNRYGQQFIKDALAWQYIDAFVQWCEKRQVTVIFMPSTLLGFDLYSRDRREREFYQTIPGIVRKKGYPFVGRPQDYMYEKKYYFNTDFHLNEAGRRLRTCRMADDLLASKLLEGQGQEQESAGATSRCGTSRTRPEK